MLDVTTGLARPRRAALALHVAFMSIALALGSGVAAATSSTQVISLWWPAVGACVLAVLAVPRSWVPAAGASVWVVMTVANLLVGRPPALSVGYGLANAVEAVLVAAVLTAGRRGPRLASIGDMGRLLVATAAGSALGASVAGATVALRSGAFLEAALPLLTSHASAVLVVVPLGIASTRRRGKVAPWHRVVQPLVLAASVVYVFAPGEPVPMTFLPMPFLIWATYLVSMRWVAVQVALVAIAVTTLTIEGRGPFALSTSLLDPVPGVQVFLITYVVTVLSFAAAQDERAAIAERLAEREQMLRGGLVEAQLGLVLMHEVSPTELVVVDANTRARELLSGQLPELPDGDDADPPRLDLDEGSGFARAVVAARRSPLGEWTDELDAPDHRRVELFVTRVERDAGDAILTAQVVDVTQRALADAAMQRALADERAAAERLRDLGRQKDDFLSSVSHELRTPITSIIGFTELVVDDTDVDDEQRRYLEVVERNARRLGALVEDLLELGAGAARNRLAPGLTRLDDALRQTAEELTPASAAGGVRLVVGPRTGLATTAAHPDVVRILTNLVSNAVKFTPADGQVTMSVERDGDVVVLEVSDTGAGIAAEDLERVFERFFRSEGAEGVPGTGLGLALVRSLVERNDGTITLSSEPGSGTRAVVRLPRAAAQGRD